MNADERISKFHKDWPDANSGTMGHDAIEIIDSQQREIESLKAEASELQAIRDALTAQVPRCTIEPQCLATGCEADVHRAIRDALQEQLAHCHRISGAESHEPAEAWRDAPYAVQAVTELRKDYDDACRQVTGALWAERKSLKAENAQLKRSLEGLYSSLDNLHRLDFIMSSAHSGGLRVPDCGVCQRLSEYEQMKGAAK